ncbi:hypothetical protein OAV92_01390 [Crocinitomicaceae bacterium]|nr:hypothetical protein [Crocinitomicaceae bacterium]
MNLGQYSFSCPQCRAELNNSKVITLNTERANRDKGVIQLSVGVGDYTFKHEPKTEFNEGEIVSFYCPHCKADLSAPQHKDFILLKMGVDENIQFDVIFSRKAGHRRTYVITEDGIESYHG